MKEKWILIVVLLIVILIFAWSPWVTKDFAEQKVLDDFSKKWYQVQDGCGFNCLGCGVHSSSKTIFGYEVLILYDCGLKAGPSPIPPYQSKLFVSFLGTVHTLSQGTNLN